MTAEQSEASAPARPAARDAFRRALTLFVAGERIDMQDLAAELAVDRTTLFRWVGNRDQLLVSVLTYLGDRALQHATEAATSTGGARLVQIAEGYADQVISASYYRAFLRREPERSLRLITTKASPLQHHLVDTFEDLITQAQAEGMVHPLPATDLAYLLVRVIESFIYADTITGEEPDAGKVKTATAALLHVDLPQTHEALTDSVNERA